MAANGALSYHQSIYTGNVWQFDRNMAARDGISHRVEYKPNPGYDPDFVGPEPPIEVTSEEIGRSVWTLSYHFNAPRFVVSPSNAAWRAFEATKEITDMALIIPQRPGSAARVEPYEGTWTVEQIACDDDPSGEMTTVSVQLKRVGEYGEYYR